MKQLLFALSAICLFTACNNNKNDKPPGANIFGEQGGNGGGKVWQNNKDKNNTGGGTGRWSKQMRDYVFNACLQEVGQAPQASEKCNCWVDKLETKYQNLKNVNQISEDVANQLAIECMQQFGGPNTGETGFGDDGFHGFDKGGYYDEDDDDYYDDEEDGYPSPGGYTPNTGGGQTGRTWAAAQRQQWMMGCTTSAQQSMGVSQQQATAYCECITRKVEAKHSFAEAAKMTAQDFSTPQWVNARMECQMNLGY